MIPVKPKVLYKQVAEEEDVSQQLVDDLVSYYYGKIRQELSDLTHTRVNIDGLGQFVIKPKAVASLTEKYTRQLAKQDGYSMASYHNKIRLESRLEELHNIAKLIEQDKQNKENFKTNKYAKRDLEKPETDNGGN